MKTIIVEDESLAADYLEELCEETDAVEIVGKFSNAVRAIEYAAGHMVDLAFLDIEMPEVSGLEAAGRLREIHPNIGVIFVTGYEQYALQAFQADAIAYILKPSDKMEVARAVEKALKLIPSSHKRILLHTFGGFDVFIDGQPIYFANAKAKELLALLVDRRGGVVNMEQATSLLWENRTYDETLKQLYRKAVIYLHQLFSQHQSDFFVSNRGSCFILPESCECDYYQLLLQNKKYIAQFNGEYMTDYSWAEATTGKIVSFLSQY